MAAHPPTLLIVEDDESSRVMYSEYLQSAGYRVLSAPDGPRALQLARELRPDLIVTDISLPGMDGRQLAQALKELSAGQRAPVIAVSGHDADDQAADELRRAGIDCVLVKPCLPDQLLAEIKRLLARPGKDPRRLPKVQELRKRPSTPRERADRFQRRRRG